MAHNPEDMTTRAQQVVQEQNAKPDQKPTTDPKTKKKNQEFRERIDLCKQYRRKLIQNWTVNIDYRRGKPFQAQPDTDQVAVNLDWPLTKTKQASLFSQVPQVRLNHHPDSAAAGPWLAKYERKLNDTFVEAGIESAMDEIVPDCINAAGIGVSLVSYEAITEDTEVPMLDMATLPPEVGAQILQTGKMPDGSDVPMEIVPRVVDKRYCIQRISPGDFLWPINFTGSNFDQAPWVGRSGRISWEEAMQKWKLDPSMKDKVIGEDRTAMDRLSQDIDKEKVHPEKNVGFDEVFYRNFQFDPDTKSFHLYHHLVFVDGQDTPVVDEPWKGQRLDPETGVLIGSRKCPLRVLSLSYITDEPIPPSDSAIGRPQVNEINKSRTQMIQQRERSLPVRWFDVNRVDPAISQALMKGTWQHMIPVQGDGTKVIGEVARAVHPNENFTFYQIAKSDLTEAWSIGPNQMASGEGVETRGESEEISQNFQVRVTRERAKVASYIVGIAEVLGGLIALYEDPLEFGEGFDPKFTTALAYSILPDSTVILDANQRLERLNGFLNTYAQSGFIAVEPVLREIAILNGLDPNVVVKAPDPKPPVEPNISLRLSGAEDMMNPLMLAFLIKSGQAPPPEAIEQAKQLIQQAVVPPTPPPGPDGQPMGPLQDPMAPPPTGAPLPPPGSAMPPEPPVPTPIGEANPDMRVLPKITKRSGQNEGGVETE